MSLVPFSYLDAGEIYVRDIDDTMN